ncbi:MAG: formyltetrahydrofolate deformylase [Gulosibacter sp.]|uniref:formyltetrahydrofolate deformylase n=1 Tax=Gulosibacter sp. TaxID=2817531 RepID=UPI003F8FCC99
MTTTSPIVNPHVIPAEQADTGRLLLSCSDQPGIVAAVTETLTSLGANITDLDQFSENADGGAFFQRTVFHLPGLSAAMPELKATLDERIGKRFDAKWRLTNASDRKRVAIFVSKTDHCLLDLLWRQRRGEINMDISMVVGNHPDLADAAQSFGVPFIHVPVGGDKREAEARHLELLRGNVDLVVLARYMQIISDDFLAEVGVPLINIHHSFLPAFVGANPYKKAKERGVKLIGATAHYVTKDLDEGPIIDQGVVRVSHRESSAELSRHGSYVERAVLSRAVQWHCDDRVMRHGNATVVF